MTVCFGYITEYNAKRGFGLINNLFEDASTTFFFHINTIRRRYPKLAKKLANQEDENERIYLWYKTKFMRGKNQVGFIWLNSAEIFKQEPEQRTVLTSNIENIWENMFEKQDKAYSIAQTMKSTMSPTRFEMFLHQKQREWEQHKKDIESAVIDVLGVERFEELVQKRKAAQIGAENSKQEQFEQIVEGMSQSEKDEFRLLIEEMRPLNFTTSKQLSMYILRHQLGRKYKTISGIVEMEKNGRTWDFNGGFSPRIYSKICKVLELSDQNSKAKVVGFQSFGQSSDE
jgi:cold shock CspA family protein